MSKQNGDTLGALEELREQFDGIETKQKQIEGDRERLNLHRSGTMKAREAVEVLLALVAGMDRADANDADALDNKCRDLENDIECSRDELANLQAEEEARRNAVDEAFQGLGQRIDEIGKQDPGCNDNSQKTADQSVEETPLDEDIEEDDSDE